MLEKGSSELSIKEQAELLGISYSSLFYEPVPPSVRELAIKRRIDEDLYRLPLLWLTEDCGAVAP